MPALLAAAIVALIALAAAAAGRLARLIHQPAMIGYVAAGMAIAFSPLSRAAAFPAAGRACALLGEAGVVAMMFAAGAEMDGGELRSRARRGVWMTVAVIVTPFLAGIVCAARYPELRARDANPLAFLLLIGTCLCITAFPVLIEILRDRKLLTTPIGAAAVASAAVNDVVAWLLLSFVAFLSAAARPAHSILGALPVFLAFFSGVLLPHAPRSGRVLAVLRRTVTAPLLPLFFAGIGLHVTAIGAGTLRIVAVFAAVAMLAKMVPAIAVVRARGDTWRDAFVLGALLNARGAMELVAAQLGADLGLLSAEGFSVLVAVAIVTTVAAGPLVHAAQNAARRMLISNYGE